MLRVLISELLISEKWAASNVGTTMHVLWRNEKNIFLVEESDFIIRSS